jgi:flagellar hook-associated protein 1 FlgK
VTATLGSANSGTLTIRSLDVRSPIVAPASAIVKFNHDPVTAASTYQISVDGGSTFAPAQPLVPGQAISLADGSGNTLWELALNGTPADGDTIRVDPTAFPAASNGNALALVALRDAMLVGGNTITEAWAGALSDIGVRVQSADGAASLSNSVASDAQARLSANAGVNLDEEAARLIQYQQSYQAAAKMLQVAQSLFDTLLQVTAR